MARQAYLSPIGGQITAATTAYIKPDGTKTTTASDPTTWSERSGFQPLHVFGSMNGGTSVIRVEMSNDMVNILQTSPDLKAQLTAGVDVDLPYRYWRIRVDQTVADTVSITLHADTGSRALKP